SSVVEPPLYGQWYPKLESLPAEAHPPFWFSEVNLEPRYRIAAGLGTLVVRYEQEALMAAAWDQLAAQQADNEQRKRVQLAEEVGHTLLEKHLAPLSPPRFLQVTAPLHATVVQRAAVKPGDAPAQTAAVSSGPASGPSALGARFTSFVGGPTSSAAFRRLSRARGPLARRLAAQGNQGGARG